MGKMQKRKGAAGEREFAKLLRDHGYEAERGRQYCGGPDSPDIKCNLPIHFEVKRVEKLNLNAAMAQAVTECPEGKVPMVAHRRNGTPWLVTMSSEAFFMMLEATEDEASD